MAQHHLWLRSDAAFVAGPLAAWFISGPARTVAIELTLAYAGSILAFLAGVRRGVSFRTEGGPHTAQILTMLWLYTLAFVTLVMLSFGLFSAATAVATIGFASVTILDPGSGAW